MGAAEPGIPALPPPSSVTSSSSLLHRLSPFVKMAVSSLVYNSGIRTK